MVVVLGVWKLGIVAHTKLSVCIRGLRETSWLLCVRWNLERVRWRFHVVRWWVWSFGGRSSFPLFGKLGGFCRALKPRFLHLFTYPARLVGCFRHGSIGRSGGLPTEGLRGYPLTIPFLAEYQGILFFTT